MKEHRLVAPAREAKSNAPFWTIRLLVDRLATRATSAASVSGIVLFWGRLLRLIEEGNQLCPLDRSNVQDGPTEHSRY